MSCSAPNIGSPSRASCIFASRRTGTENDAPLNAFGNLASAARRAASFAAASCAAASFGSNAAAAAIGPNASVALSAACSGSLARTRSDSARAVFIAAAVLARAAAASTLSSTSSSRVSFAAITAASAAASAAASLSRFVSIGCIGPYSSDAKPAVVFGIFFRPLIVPPTRGHDAFCFSSSIGSSSSAASPSLSLSSPSPSPPSSSSPPPPSSPTGGFSRLWSLESSVPGRRIPARSALSSRRRFSLAVRLCPIAADPCSSASDASDTSFAASRRFITLARSPRFLRSSSSFAIFLF
mmetsp:Transcript_3485/g.11827  ORF Transcript_3485/g.11827 Transcript_3485/m.11827 type:complete len:297 (-) Transcript_3485:49-939(-)